MKKKTIANLIMVAIIMVIIVAGVLGVGCIRGWFDSDDGSYAILSEIRGIVNIEREGVSYPAENGTILRSGDKLSCNSGTTAVVKLTDGNLTLSNSAVMRIEEASAEGFRAEVRTGEVFVNTVSAASLSFEGNTEQFSNTVAQLSVRSGAQSVSVFSGTVGDAQAGQMLNWVNGEQSVGKLAIQSLTSDKFTCLFGNLIPSISLLLVMVFRMVPNFIRKTQQIIGARKSIGKGYSETATTKDKIQDGGTVLGALTSWALEGSVVTGDSMRARGYGAAKRSSFMIYRMTGTDWILLVVMLVLLGVTIAAAFFGQFVATFVPAIDIAPVSWGLAAYTCYLLIPTALHIKEAIQWHISRSKI